MSFIFITISINYTSSMSTSSKIVLPSVEDVLDMYEKRKWYVVTDFLNRVQDRISVARKNNSHCIFVYITQEDRDNGMLGAIRDSLKEIGLIPRKNISGDAWVIYLK